MNKIAVIERLQTEVGKVEVALRLDGCSDLLHIVLRQAGIQQFQSDSFVGIGLEVVAIEPDHFGLGGDAGIHIEKGECLAAQCIEQQSRSNIGVVGLLLDHGARGHHQCVADILLLDAVEQVVTGIFDDRLGGDVAETLAGFRDQRPEA